MKRFFIFIFVILLLTSCQKIKPITEPASSGSVVSTSIVSQPESNSCVPEQTSSIFKVVSSTTESKTSSSQNVSSQEIKKELTVSIKISGINVVIFESSAVQITENMTVYDLTKKVCEDNNIVFQSEPGYIKKIGDFEEFKPTVQSGWIFKLNGVKSPVGCGSVKLKGNEKIEWFFSTNYGKDVQ